MMVLAERHKAWFYSHQGTLQDKLDLFDATMSSMESQTYASSKENEEFIADL